MQCFLQIWYFPAIGALGATIANTSGTGGGVVFVPLFNILRESQLYEISPMQVTAASFLIQCFGMTIGALRWTNRVTEHADAAEDEHGIAVQPRDYWSVILVVLAISLPVMLATQRLSGFDPRDVLIGFKAFSIILGSTHRLGWNSERNPPEQRRLKRVDLVVLILLAGPGGFLTALFSVGIGELVALYLFIRHYPILLCTGTACVISSISVLTGAIFHIEMGNVPWEVVILAAPGAAVGGFIARPLALWLGALRLKTLDGMWIILSSLYLIAINLVH
ncbi:MAG: sulfite exporter TauE/SafE family protein [Parasphingorhabdus sp.]|nr:sulfite exporter TauE/SafE family protein [Parasphingorhabdus sp.]